MGLYDKLTNDVKKALEYRSMVKAIDANTTQLTRIADALEVFSEPAKRELLETVERNIRRRNPASKMTVDSLDVGAANRHYEQQTNDDPLENPPPPDNTQVTEPF